MKRFFQLLLTGLVLMIMTVAFTSQKEFAPVDDDVGYSMQIDNHDDIAIATDFEIETYKQYQEVGIVPTLNSNIISNVQGNYDQNIEMLQCSKYDNKLNINVSVKHVYKENWYYVTNNYVTTKDLTNTLNIEKQNPERYIIQTIMLTNGKEVIGLVPDPNKSRYA